MKMIYKWALGLMAFSLLTPFVPNLVRAACTTNQPAAAELKLLQGTWKGVLVGQESAGKISITISGNSLRFNGLNTNEWYEATFTLPGGTSPPQLLATITACQRTNDIGAVVGAIFKVEAETLTLAGIQERDQAPPKSFGEEKSSFRNTDGGFNVLEGGPGLPSVSRAFEDNTLFRYELRKVQPETKNVETSTSK